MKNRPSIAAAVAVAALQNHHECTQPRHDSLEAAAADEELVHEQAMSLIKEITHLARILVDVVELALIRTHTE